MVLFRCAIKKTVLHGFRKPQRITITVAYATHEKLNNDASQEGRSLSNLCAYILERYYDKKD
jgi:hypothetical protein